MIKNEHTACLDSRLAESLDHPADAGDPPSRRPGSIPERATVTTGDAATTSDLIALAAETLHRCGTPGAGARLRDEHARDRHGRCRGCPHEGTVAPYYPCRLRLIGEAAARLDNRPATPEGDPE